MERSKLIIILAVVVLVHALALVYIRHLNRQVFTEIEAQSAARDSLNIDWGRLQLERATWSRHSLVETEAREALGMVVPATESVIRIRISDEVN